MPVEIKQVTQTLQGGEGPHWDECTQALYFVDIMEPTIHRYVPETNKHTYAHIGNEKLGTSIIIPVKSEPNKFVITIGANLALVTWDGVSSTVSDIEILASAESHTGQTLRFNDGKTNPEGILFAGTMADGHMDVSTFPKVGSFYAFSKKQLIPLFDEIAIANGLAWSADLKNFYHIDSLKYKVDVFDYDAKQISVSNKRTLFDFKENNIPGLPDGMTIDSDGNLWVACYEGGQVLKIDGKTGSLLTSIKMPCSTVTSVAFGGPTLEDLYVTSLNFSWSKNEKLGLPAGCTFKVTGTGSKGIAGVPVQL